MNTRMHALLMALFIVPALFSSPANKAGTFEAASRSILRGMLAVVKNCFTREKVTAVTCGSARALWNIAKVGVVGTVLANIFMPISWRQWFVKNHMSRFVFAREQLLSKLPKPENMIGAMPTLATSSRENQNLL